jgi:hypothetical protein
LLWREYRNQAEFIASGIPMHFADQRGTFGFNSGGMFEVSAQQGGAALQIADGFSCDISFQPTHELNSPSLYYFNAQADNWEYVSASAFGSQSENGLAPVVSEATVIANNVSSNRSNENAGIGSQNQRICDLPFVNLTAKDDTAAIIRAAIDMGYQLAFEQAELPVWFSNSMSKSDEKIMDGLERGLVRIVKHKDSGTNFFPTDLAKNFTELEAFKGIYFAAESDSAKRIITAPLSSKGDYWQRITVVQDYPGSEIMVSLFDEERGLVQAYATMLSSDTKVSIDPTKVMAKYNEIRDKRRGVRMAEIQRYRQFFMLANCFKVNGEWCLNDYAWWQYFKENKAMMRERYAKLLAAYPAGCSKQQLMQAWAEWTKRQNDFLTNNVLNNNQLSAATKQNIMRMYTLRVNRFGTYNCDQLFRLGNPVAVQAAYRDQNGRTIIPSNVALMEKSTKIYLTMPTNGDFQHVVGRKINVIVTDVRGQTYLLPEDEFAKIRLNGQRAYTYSMREVTDEYQQPEDWQRWLSGGD